MGCRNSHLLFLLVLLCLSGMGVAYLFSTGYLGAEYAVRGNYLRQCGFLLFGVVLGAAAFRMTPGSGLWRIVVFAGYCLSLLLLVLVLLAGKSIGGARRWLVLGPFLLQPAEFARVFTILAGALLLDGKFLPRRWEFLFGVGCYLLPMGLILLEPSYGNAASLAIPLAVMLGLRYFPKWLWITTVLVAVSGVLALSLAIQHLRLLDETGTPVESLETGWGTGVFHGYHLRRLRSFLSAEGGWNEQQSVMAVAGGGLTGKGYLSGTMKNLGFLPRTVAPTDFIFAVVAEEGGLLFGVLPLLLLYWLLFLLLTHWAARSQNRLCLNLLAGGSALLFTHVVVNIGMTIRLLPVIGLPLPLLSYGGSFTVSVLLLLAMMASADYHRTEQPSRIPCARSSESIWALGRLLRVKLRM